MALAAVLIAVAVLLVALAVLWRKGRVDGDHATGALDFAANLALAVYLLVLAYAAVLGNDAVDMADTDAVAESESLVELYWAVAPLPEAVPQREQIKEYTEQSIRLDWPLMAQGRLSPVPGQTLDDLRASLISLTPVGERGVQARTDALRRAAEVSHARAIRAADARSSLDPIFLISMVLSGLVVIVLPWFAGVRPSFGSVVGDVVRVGVVVAGIVVILQLDNPYTGFASVGTEALQTAQGQFTEIDARFPG